MGLGDGTEWDCVPVLGLALYARPSSVVGAGLQVLREVHPPP